jgi:thiamine kinase-like enzyme
VDRSPDTDIGTIVRRVPAWSKGGTTIRPLPGGITNRNYVVTYDGDDYVVRIPGERTQLLGINRASEQVAAQRAADLGIGPPVFGELPGVGTQITQFIEGRHLEEADFADRLGDIVSLLHRFHHSGDLPGEFPIHRVVEWHARDASSHGVVPPNAYERLHQQSRHIERAFAAAPTRPVPCHNDLLPSNVLFAEDRVWLLDYEYAGMNDVFFDLANLSVNSSFSPARDEELLRLYFGGITRSRWARLQLMKVMSEFREGMWAVVQDAISSLDTDFVTYGKERLANCERLAASPDFGRWLIDARLDPRLG